MALHGTLNPRHKGLWCDCRGRDPLTVPRFQGSPHDMNCPYIGLHWGRSLPWLSERHVSLLQPCDQHRAQRLTDQGANASRRS